jgi:hypothetical protein
MSLRKIQTMVRLQLGQVLVEFRRHTVQDNQQVVDNCRRILDDETGNQIRIRRDVLQRTHRRRLCQP